MTVHLVLGIESKHYHMSLKTLIWYFERLHMDDVKQLLIFSTVDIVQFSFWSEEMECCSSGSGYGNYPIWSWIHMQLLIHRTPLTELNIRLLMSTQLNIRQVVTHTGRNRLSAESMAGRWQSLRKIEYVEWGRAGRHSGLAATLALIP